MTTKLEAILQREQAATEGPWAARMGSADVWVAKLGQWSVTSRSFQGGKVSHDAAFIAHARTDIPALLAVADKARLVSQWAGNVAEWPVPPPLDAELRDLRAALAPLLEPEG